MAADLYYWYTSLVLNFTGADNSTTITDESPTPKSTNTVAGNAKITSNALALDGSGDYINYASNAAFDFGASDDFAIEFDWTPTTASGADQVLLHYGATTFSANTDMAIYVIHAPTALSGKVRASIYSGTTAYSVDSLAALVAGTKYRIAITRVSGTLRLFIQGVLQQSVSAAVAINTPSGRIFDFGRFVAADPRYASGSFDKVRITKGQGRYIVSYTPDTDDLLDVPAPGTVDADLSAPMGTLVARSGAYTSLTAPAGTLASKTGMTVNLTAPQGVLRSVSHDSTGERAFVGSAPMGQLVAQTGAIARMQAPMGTLVASVTVPISVRAELTAPSGSLVSSSTVSVMVNADLRLSRAGTLVATGGAQARMTGPMGTLQAVATVGALVRFAGSVPIGELTTMMTAGIVVQAELVAPMIRPAPRASAQLVAPMGRLTAVASAVVTVVYEAYAVNLKPGPKMPNQVTRYTNFPFNQILRFKDRYIGVADDGLYQLGGATDYDPDTPAGPAWSWHTAITDFNSSQHKNVREAIFAGRLGPAATASVSVREATDRTYAATIVRGTSAQNHRIKMGRGLKARYWSFGLSDDAGGECDVDRVEFDVAELGRKL